jgi:hypothetical protein
LLVMPLVEGPPGAMRRRATNNNQEDQIQERKKTQDDQDENTTGTDYPEDVPAVITKKRRVRTITREGNHFKHKVNWCKNIWSCEFRKEGKCFCAHNLQEWIVANANARGIKLPPASSLVSFFSILFLISFLLCSTIYLSSSLTPQ